MRGWNVRLPIWIAFTCLALVPVAAAEDRPAADSTGAALTDLGGPDKGTLLLASLNDGDIRAKFLELAGGPEARIVLVLNRLPPGVDLKAASPSASRGWRAKQVTVWYAQGRADAEAATFLDALKGATGVWFGGGRPQLYADAYVGSAAARELAGVLRRGGVVGGESAGAMIQSTFLSLPAPGPEPAPPLAGFGFIRHVAIFPHFNGDAGKFPLKACEKIVAENPGLLGLAIRDGAAVIVRGDDAEVFGKGDVSELRPAEDGTTTVTTHAPGRHIKISQTPRK